MKAFLAFIVGLVVGILVQRYVIPPSGPILSRSTTDKISLPEINFDSEKIKEELSRSGQVIREKAREAGAAISDATADARTTATIKGKLIREPGLSAFQIDVDTNGGVVTLSGTVNSHDQIATVMKLAMETEGVHKVVSALQVKSG